MGRPRAPRPDVPSSADIHTSGTHVPASCQIDDATQPTIDIPSGRLSTSTPVPEHEAANIVAADPDAVDDASAIPIIQPQRRSLGFDTTRVWSLSIVNGDRLEPSNEVARWISTIWQEQPDANAWDFQHASQATKNRWFDAWRAHFTWDETEPGMDMETIRRLWNDRAQEGYNDMVGKARRKDKKPNWVQQKPWDSWKVVWDSPQFKAKSLKQKQNRAANPHLHTSGSRSHSKVRKDMVAELGREPTPLELHIKTHKRKKDGEFVDNRSRRIAERSQEVITQRSTQSNTPLSYQEECDAYLEAVGGVGPGGAIAGLGSAASHFYGDQIRAPRKVPPRMVELQRENETLRSQIVTLTEAQATQATQIQANNTQIEELRRFVEELRANRPPPSTS